MAGDAAAVGGWWWWLRTKLFICSQCSCEFLANAADALQYKEKMVA